MKNLLWISTPYGVSITINWYKCIIALIMVLRLAIPCPCTGLQSIIEQLYHGVVNASDFYQPNQTVPWQATSQIKICRFCWIIHYVYIVSHGKIISLENVAVARLHFILPLLIQNKWLWQQSIQNNLISPNFHQI